MPFETRQRQVKSEEIINKKISLSLFWQAILCVSKNNFCFDFHTARRWQKKSEKKEKSKPYTAMTQVEEREKKRIENFQLRIFLTFKRSLRNLLLLTIFLSYVGCRNDLRNF